MKNTGLKNLTELSLAARKKAYAPYSKKFVGAALRTTSGEIFTGSNIENVSFGGTVCAERVAIWKAVSDNPKTRIAEIVVATGEKKPWSPCGFCRQVLAEFAAPDLKVHLANTKGIQSSLSFAKDLFPRGFTPEQF